MIIFPSGHEGILFPASPCSALRSALVSVRCPSVCPCAGVSIDSSFPVKYRKLQTEKPNVQRLDFFLTGIILERLCTLWERRKEKNRVSALASSRQVNRHFQISDVSLWEKGTFPAVETSSPAPCGRQAAQTTYTIEVWSWKCSFLTCSALAYLGSGTNED